MKKKSAKPKASREKLGDILPLYTPNGYHKNATFLANERPLDLAQKESGARGGENFADFSPP